jgi:hypothetical protein
LTAISGYFSGTYYNDAWVREQHLDLRPYLGSLETFLERGAFPAAGFGT